MAKPKRKLVLCDAWKHDDWSCNNRARPGTTKCGVHSRKPTDTERLDALLRWASGLGIPVWPVPGMARKVRARRDIDKLLKEERHRAK